MMNKSREKTGFKTRYFLSYAFLIILTVGFGIKVQSNDTEVERVIVWVGDAEQDTAHPDVSNKELRASKEKEPIQNESIETGIQPIVPSFESNSSIGTSATNAIKDSLKKIKSNEIKEIETKEIDGNTYYILKYNNGEENDTLMTKSKEKDLQTLFKNKNDYKKEFFPYEFFEKSADYSDYHKLLPNWEGGVYKKNKSEIIPDGPLNIPREKFKVPDNVKSFKIDSLFLNGKELRLKNGVIQFHIDSLINGPIRFKADSLFIKPFEKKEKEAPSEITYWQNNKNGFPMIPAKAFENGKNPLIFIEGKISTIEKLKELEGREGYRIIYMTSEQLIQDHGEKAKDGVIMARKLSGRNK